MNVVYYDLYGSFVEPIFSFNILNFFECEPFKKLFKRKFFLTFERILYFLNAWSLSLFFCYTLYRISFGHLVALDSVIVHDISYFYNATKKLLKVFLILAPSGNIALFSDGVVSFGNIFSQRIGDKLLTKILLSVT